MLNALTHDDYVGGGDISSTKLISPPRITALRKFHEDEIVEDASSRIWSLLGKSVHYVVANSAGVNPDEFVRETRLQMPIQGIEKDDGFWTWKLSGQPDVFHKTTGILYDYKVTSVWSLILGEKPEWEKQLNIQALLHRHNGDTVKQGFIIAILRDWKVSKATYEKNYPTTAAQAIGFPIWTKEEQLDYVKRRVRLHQTAQNTYLESGKDSTSLPLCTPDERWYRGHKYKVKKQDAKGKVNLKADRVFDNLTDARQWMSDNSTSLPKGKVWAPVEETPGQNLRCQFYCDVWRFCDFGRKVHEALQPVLVNETEESND
jgi:hypothetical protein